MPEKVRLLSKKLEEVFSKLIKDVPSFEVLNKDVLPYGLKQHTRSICWLAEQVVLQNVKKRAVEYGISNYQDPASDISAWDACLAINGCANAEQHPHLKGDLDHASLKAVLPLR